MIKLQRMRKAKGMDISRHDSATDIHFFLWSLLIIYSFRSENIVATSVEIKGTAEITIPGGQGVIHLREALIAGRDNVREKNTSINIYTEGSPRYAIEVKSEDYKKAEKALENALERIEDVVEDHNGTFSFTRKK